MEELKVAMALQTELLRQINDNIVGMRAEMKEEKDKAMNEVMKQTFAAFKGTPMEGMLASLMAKSAGGQNG